MIESILFLICSVWLPALLVTLHHSEERQQSRLYEWTEPSAEAGRWHWSHCDVTPETKRREGALWPPPPPLHSFVCFCCFCLTIFVPSPGCCVLWWAHISSRWLTNLFSHPSPTEDAPLLSSQAYLAQLCLFQTNGHFPQLPDSRFPTCTFAWLMFSVF